MNKTTNKSPAEVRSRVVHFFMDHEHEHSSC